MFIRKYNVAIVGATGLVGNNILKLLIKRKFPIKHLKLLASERSAGKQITVGRKNFIIEEATEKSFQGIDLAFFTAGSAISKKLAQKAVNQGAIVIDNTSAYRMKKDIPLVVPEVNEESLQFHNGIIANPNCSTIQMVVALAPLKKHFGIHTIIVSTYQSVSGAGNKQVKQLMEDTLKYLQGDLSLSSPNDKQSHVAFNLIPQIDEFMKEGYTGEEMKMINETKKIFSDPHLRIAATCVRVPIFYTHSESIYIELEKEIDTIQEIKTLLEQSKGIAVLDHPEKLMYPTPHYVTEKEDVFVGRIRKDLTNPKGIHLWVVSDNLLKGAALNSVQIAETLLKQNLLKI